jgi:hypothetical protein
VFVLLSLFVAPAAFGAQGNIPLCGVNESQILGQPWKLNGAAGGIATEQYLIDNGLMANVLEPFDFGPVAIAAADYPANVSDSVHPTIGVLIVDDFSTPLALNYDSHGDYVHRTMVSLYNSLPADLQAEILIREVNVGPGYDADTIIDGIDAAIAEGGENFSTIGQYVVNMSFVLMPCQVQFVYEGTVIDFNYRDFLGQYQESVQSDNPLSLLSYLGTAFGLDVSIETDRFILAEVIADGIEDGANLLDPLHDYLTAFPSTHSVNLISVASAGNLGETSFGDAPFAPGVWEEVISVSSTDVNSGAVPPLNEWSNWGEISAPGAWYPFGANESGTPIFGAGTSFAAPAASLFTAIHLIDNACTYAPLASVPAAGPFDNLWYMDAIPVNC